MKTQIFVSDGYPEAEDYDSNYVDYDPQDQASVEDAKAEARRIIQVMHPAPADQRMTALRFQPAGPVTRLGAMEEPQGRRTGWIDGLMRFLFP